MSFSDHTHDSVYSKIGHTHISTDITDVIPISKGGTGVTTLDELKAIMKSAADYSDMHETVTVSIHLKASDDDYNSAKFGLPDPSFPWKSFAVTEISGGWTIESSTSTSVHLTISGVSSFNRCTIYLDTDTNTLSGSFSGSISSRYIAVSQYSYITLYANG